MSKQIINLMLVEYVLAELFNKLYVGIDQIKLEQLDIGLKMQSLVSSCDEYLQIPAKIIPQGFELVFNCQLIQDLFLCKKFIIRIPVCHSRFISHKPQY